MNFKVNFKSFGKSSMQLYIAENLAWVMAKLGIDVTSTTALLHLGAGTATAGTAPLKFTAGTLLTTPEIGAVEFADNNLYFTNVAVRRPLDRSSDVVLSTVTVTNTVVETTLYTGILGADALNAGNHIRLHVNGIITNATAADDITIKMYMGATQITTFNPAIGKVANADWHLDSEITIRSAGATGSIAFHGHAEIDANEDTQNSIVTIDTTAAQNLTVTVTWDAAKAGNILSLYQGALHWAN